MDKIEIVFFDIDWTLYDHKNHRWAPNAVSFINQLKAQGVRCVICTARPYHSMKMLGVFDLGIDWDAYIASSGAIAFVDGKYLKKDLMDPKDVYKAVEFLKEHGETGEIVEPMTRFLVAPQTESSKKYYQVFFESLVDVQEYRGEEATGLNIFIPKHLDQELQGKFGHLCLFRYFETAVDLMPIAHIKGAAIPLILDYYGIKKENAMAIGDDDIDISMKEAVGHFVAMGNAKENVQKEAEFVCGKVWGKGITTLVREYFLLD